MCKVFPSHFSPYGSAHSLMKIGSQIISAVLIFSEPSEFNLKYEPLILKEGIMNIELYQYNAKVMSVYDGDTIRVDIDLGLKTWIKNESIRFNRINAPEVRGSERPMGLQSRDYLRKLILKKDVIIQTVKDKKGKYGRYLGEIWLEKDGQYLNINDLLVKEGYAIYKQY